MLRKFQLSAANARNVNDPNFYDSSGMKKYIFTVPVRNLPNDISLDPNARNPSIGKRVYKKVIDSLLQRDGSGDGTFHLKNKGITIIANSVTDKGQNLYEIELETGRHGIVDGGHTYTIITQHKDNPQLPDDQYVNVEVHVGVPDDWISAIAGGLNTTVQVQDMSLDDLAGKFLWLKSELQAEPYAENIAWSENDGGEFDARDIISMLLCFNITLYPNEGPNKGTEHPIAAYSQKATALKKFEEHGTSFEHMRSILKDILKFYDTISQEARILYNRDTEGSAGNLAFVESTKKKLGHTFIFTNKTDEFRLTTGALYPMLAAFRWYVQEDPLTGNMEWEGGFDNVLKQWDKLGAELMVLTVDTSRNLARNPQLIGKSRSHWSSLHSLVGIKKLTLGEKPV